MAAGIYKEWFVRMRINGEDLPKNKETGLPIGWEVRKIGEVLDITGGGTPSTEVTEYWENGEINWYSPTDITSSDSIFLNNSKSKITEKGLKNSSARLFPPYSVMITSRATIGEVGINTTEACTNQGFIVCFPNKILSFPYLYFWVKQNKDYMNTLATGATFGEVSKTTFKKMEIIVPSISVMDNFNKIIIPLFTQIKPLQEQTAHLRQIRDRLLPRLMSGDLGV
jgi:type I restriction enzyme, S subunit